MGNSGKYALICAITYPINSLSLKGDTKLEEYRDEEN